MQHVSTHINMCWPILVKIQGMSRHITLMHRRILSSGHKTEAGKDYESTHTRFALIQEDAWFDTSHYVSTHTELILFYRSRKKLCVDAYQHGSTHKQFKMHFPFVLHRFHIVFIIIRYGCNILVSTSSPLLICIPIVNLYPHPPKVM